MPTTARVTALDRRFGFSVDTGREAKAAKIEAVIAMAGHQIRANSRLLDLGTVSGHIAGRFAEKARVVATDYRDQRDRAHQSTPYVLAGVELPFAGSEFDLLTAITSSNASQIYNAYRAKLDAPSNRAAACIQPLRTTAGLGSFTLDGTFCIGCREAGFRSLFSGPAFATMGSTYSPRTPCD